VRDPIPAERLFERRGVEPTTPSNAVHAIPGSEEGAGGQRTPHRERQLQSYQTAQAQKGEQPAQFAYQLMSSPVFTVSITATVADTLTLFKTRNFRHAPVMGEDGTIIGLVSDRDLLRFVVGRDEALPHENQERLEERLASSIELLLRPRVLTASMDTEIRYVAKILYEQHVGAMPIVNNEGILLGIITRSDILRALVKNMKLELWA
ncbi:MAG: hypothetical protein FD130_2332, partial [Halothiobacillaceae bacterium]